MSESENAKGRTTRRGFLSGAAAVGGALRWARALFALWRPTSDPENHAHRCFSRLEHR